MAYRYLRSTDVDVFPSGFRGSQFIKSKLTTEENLTSYFGKLSKDSINNRFCFEDANIGRVILGIDGYVFSIDRNAFYDILVEDTGEPVPTEYFTAFIMLRDLQGDGINYGKVLRNIEEPTAILDWEDTTTGDYYFRGLGFSTGVPSGAIGVTVAERKDNAIVIKDSVKYRLSSNEIRDSIRTEYPISEIFTTETLYSTTSYITHLNTTTETVGNGAFTVNPQEVIVGSHGDPINVTFNNCNYVTFMCPVAIQGDLFSCYAPATFTRDITIYKNIKVMDIQSAEEKPMFEQNNVQNKLIIRFMVD